MESYLALRRRLEPARLLGTTTVTENGNQKWCADFSISNLGDIILGIFLTADQNRLERTELYCNADLLAVNRDPISLSNERIFTEEDIPKIKLMSVHIKMRVVYNNPGAEHAKVSVLTELLPNEIRLNIEHNKGNLTIPASKSPMGNEISMGFFNSTLTGFPYPDKFEYYPVGKKEGNYGAVKFILPQGPYILSKITLNSQQNCMVSCDLGEIHNYHLQSQPPHEEFFIPQRDGSPLKFKIFKCCFNESKIYAGGILEPTTPILKLTLERVPQQEIDDVLGIEPEYVELKEGKTAIYKEGTFKLYKLEPEN